MYPTIRHILPMTIIRRERVLPVPGKVLVRKGQNVNSSDVIAEADITPQYLLLDIARLLRLAPQKAQSILQCQEGDQVLQGDILAGPVGLLRRLVRSPRDGRVVLVSEGQILLEIAGKPHRVQAGLPGQVVELIAQHGAIIESGGALLQGVWGNGKMDFGTLRVAARAPDEPLQTASLDVSLRGSILVGGICSQEEVLKAAEELPLRGLILASMAARCRKTALHLSLPVVLMEGFGRLGYTSLAYQLLTSNEGRPAALLAEMGDSYSATRPEVVIPLPLPTSTTPPKDIISLEVNQTVRLLRAPHSGAIGTILAQKGRMVFENRLRASAVEVRLENGQIALVPLANLEVIA